MKKAILKPIQLILFIAVIFMVLTVFLQPIPVVHWDKNDPKTLESPKPED